MLDENSGGEPPVLVTAALSRFMESSLAQLVTRRKTDEIHNHLSLFMPEGGTDEHVVRAEAMCQQGSRWAAATSVELILFFYSNNLDEPTDGTARAMRKADQRVLQLIDVFEKIGAPALRVLQQAPAATAQALLDRFFASAVRLGRVDTLRRLAAMGLDVRSRVRKWIRNPEDGDTIAPIDAALLANDAGMVDFLLDQGATFVCLSDDEAAVKGLSPTRSIHWAMHGYNLQRASPSLGSSGAPASLVLRALEAQKGLSYPETELIGHLDAMSRHDKSKFWHATALPILDILWSIEKSSGLENRLAALVYAIRFGHREMIEALAARVSDINAAWDDRSSVGGITAMAEAAFQADHKCCELLFRHGAGPDPAAASTVSALQIAAFMGDAELACLLVEKGANVNYRHDDPMLGGCDTPVCAALRERHVPIVELLLDHGADMSASDLVSLEELDPSSHIGLMNRLVSRGSAFAGEALVQAVRWDNHALAELLVEVGATWACENRSGETPLALALALGYADLVAVILRSGPLIYDPSALLAATISATTIGNSGTPSQDFDTILASRGLGDRPRNAWELFLEGLALALAVCLGIEDAVVRLLRIGAHPTKNPRGTLSAFLNRFRLSDTTCEVFGVGPGSAHDYNLLVPGVTLLGTACLAQQPAMVRLLLRHGYRPNLNDLAIAADRMDLATVEHLLIAADLQGRRGHRWRGRLLAQLIRRGWTGLVHSLLDQGADVNLFEVIVPCATTLRRRTPLQAAVATEDMKMVRRLIRAKAEVNTRTVAPGSLTALQVAAARGNMGIARLLVETGADCNAPAPKLSGMTALEGAAEYGRIDMLQYLLCQGVRTEDGADRRQYFRAIRRAEENGHHFAADILKQWREWTDEDEAVFATIDADDDLDAGYADSDGFRTPTDDEDDDRELQIVEPHQAEETNQQGEFGGLGQQDEAVGGHRQRAGRNHAGSGNLDAATQTVLEESIGPAAINAPEQPAISVPDLCSASQGGALTLFDEYFPNWPAAEVESGDGQVLNSQREPLSSENHGGQILGATNDVEDWTQWIDWAA